MTTVDLLFPVLGSSLPTDHGYALYSCLSHQLPCLHDGGLKFGMATITGRHVGGGMLQLDPRKSRLRLRLSAADIPQVLPLAGRGLDVMGHRIRLGVPQIQALHPAPALIARTVAIKNATEPQPFLDAARKMLDAANIGGSLSVPEHRARDGSTRAIRRVLRIKGVRIVCFSLLVEGLEPEESLRLQDSGLGGRRHLGCGLFVPARAEANGHVS